MNTKNKLLFFFVAAGLASNLLVSGALGNKTHTYQLNFDCATDSLAAPTVKQTAGREGTQLTVLFKGIKFSEVPLGRSHYNSQEGYQEIPYYIMTSQLAAKPEEVYFEEKLIEHFDKNQNTGYKGDPDYPIYLLKILSKKLPQDSTSADYIRLLSPGITDVQFSVECIGQDFDKQKVRRLGPPVSNKIKCPKGAGVIIKMHSPTCDINLSNGPERHGVIEIVETNDEYFTKPVNWTTESGSQCDDDLCFAKN